MSLDIWSRDDIRNVLLALAAATDATDASDEYRRGYASALTALGLAFGIRAEPSVRVRFVEQAPARIPISCRAEQALTRLLDLRDSR